MVQMVEVFFSSSNRTAEGRDSSYLLDGVKSFGMQLNLTAESNKRLERTRR